MLKLTNTLTTKLETFEPLKTGHVAMYVCGITPYAPSHLGHARCYITFDTLYRLLKFLKYSVTYCRNFTDIDDKLLIKAQQEFDNPLRYPDVAERNIHQFHQDMSLLNCLPPTHEPRVTEHIPQIIEFIQALIDKGYAYQANGDVYYRVHHFKEYGKLSKQNIDELCSGVRIEIKEDKENPLDFALWKSEAENEFWKSPWGWGRPGWHIECSALAATYLGEHIDLHGGGLDLIFPHHENEIAQSEARYGAPFARCWMHNGLVNINKEKMSKSLGNVYDLHQLFAMYDPMVIRFYLLSHHYRMPFDFSLEGLERAHKTYQRLCAVYKTEKDHDELPAESENNSPILSKMFYFLYDDMNTQGMFGVLFEHLPTLEPSELLLTKYVLKNILGLTLQPVAEKEVTITPEIQKLLQERDQARLEKNWSHADALRLQLLQLGYQVQDKKQS
jgi:cysteinyl-tRNA synthetase